MSIVIKKRVNFDFLGEGYEQAYLVFQSIPLKDYGELVDKIKEVDQDDTKAAAFMLEALQKYFIEGSFPDLEKVTAEDLEGLDAESVIKCFAKFTGQDPDPKVEEPLTKPSTTTDNGPQS